LQNSQVLLHEAISSSLMSLGESIMKTIVWHLNAQGVFLDQKTEIPIALFNEHMRQIVGNLADEVMREIVDRLEEADPVLARQIGKSLDFKAGVTA